MSANLTDAYVHEASSVTFINEDEEEVHLSGMQETHGFLASQNPEKVHTEDDEIVTSLSKFHMTSKELWRCNRGVVLVLGAMFFAASMDMIVRMLEMPSQHNTQAMSSFQVLLIRQVVASAGIAVYSTATQASPIAFLLGDKKIRWLLAGRGFAGFTAVFGIYFSLPYLSLTEATVFTFMAPIITCYANATLLKGEPFSYSQQLASAISFLGVFLVALFSQTDSQRGFTASAPAPTSTDPRPSVGLRVLVICVALLGVLGQTGGMITTRLIGPRAHPLVIMNYSSVASIVVCGTVLSILHDTSWIRLSSRQWLLLLTATLCGFMFQLLLTKGLQYGAISHGRRRSDRGQEEMRNMQGQYCGTTSVQSSDEESMLEETNNIQESPRQHVGVNRAVGTLYTQAIFALMYDWIVWRKLPQMPSWIGIVCIAVGAVLIAVTQ